MPVAGGLVISVTVIPLSGSMYPQFPQKRALTGNSVPQNSQRCIVIPHTEYPIIKAQCFYIELCELYPNIDSLSKFWLFYNEVTFKTFSGDHRRAWPLTQSEGEFLALPFRLEHGD